MAKIAEQFEDFKLNRQLLNAVTDMGYQNPTPIQKKAIPLILAGHDLLGIAQTGTGKTAAFILPILMKIKYAQGNTPRALILAPTRELALQIYNDVVNLSKYTDLRSVPIYGGVGPTEQLKKLQEGVDILVATPGRFLDLYRQEAIITKQLNTLVLDEADKMMDMGFMPQLREIFEKIPNKRQNLLFSATMPDKVQRLSNEFLTFPEMVEVTPQATPAELVDQYYIEVPNFISKIKVLAHLLKDDSFSRVIVFVRSKETANNLFKFVERKLTGGCKVIHSNKAQRSRINAINEFSEGLVRVLVTTDISSRGHDIPHVSHVINFETPLVYEDYVHRIGRTGRAENKGVAITLANEADLMHLERIEKITQKPITKLPQPEGITYSETPKEEHINIMREIDKLKRRENPDFKGAFHEKKQKPGKLSPKKNVSGKRKR